MNTEQVPAVSGVESQILSIRGQRVLLSTSLADFYQVEARALVQAVKRNPGRFPGDFAFTLTPQEVALLRSQFVILADPRHRRFPPMAFTEQGVAMLSSVLRSERAVRVNVAIMRAFVKLRETLSAHRELAVKLAELERKIANHDEHIQSLFDAIHQLMRLPDPPPRKEIGYHVRERAVRYRTARDRR